ncbi:CAAX farnesyltransferase (FTase) subunit beta [Ciborinia camelliae]|nr:CAAX farnesyltransferase (FTase) subunit beta [Ciborinia camelliae]
MEEKDLNKKSSPLSPSSRLNQLLYGDSLKNQPQRSGFVIQESSCSKADVEAETDEDIDIVYGSSRPITEEAFMSMIPDTFKEYPPLRDLLETQTSHLQDQTIEECLPFLSGTEPGITYNPYGVPHLSRKKHIQFLHKQLQRLPSAYVAADASRPWMFYWALAGLSTLGQDISSYREKIISTCRPIQNATGGFGGGNGQMSHLATTYANVLSIAMVGGKEALDIIDRKAMWKWLGKLKMCSGGFRMAVGGEEDIRGAYCALILITLLNLPLDLPQDAPARSSNLTTFIDGLPEWISRCQTFEGGIGARPNVEAHGAYAFLALGCLYLDVPGFISWLSARQYAPEGGFSGRTNKLVDGCYSHWVGGCWPLLEACLEGPTHQTENGSSSSPTPVNLYSREGLIRYILCCCQDTGNRGGLRDKPSHRSDSYHTCYVLAGLSSAQHKWHFNTSAQKTESSSGMLFSPYQWTAERYVETTQIYDEEDRVGTLHPVFVIPEGVAEETRAYFASKGTF